MVIRTPDHHLRVFVSSTLKELAEERKAVRQAILKLRLAPVMFESGARPHPAQELYKSYLSQSQIFIGLYWQSYGWIGPGASVSGLEDEYNLSAKIPRLIYIKSPAPDRQPALAVLLDRIRDDNTSCYTFFTSPHELNELVQNDLALLLSERFETESRIERPQAGPPEPPRTNVPLPRNPLIDRQQESASLKQLLLHDDIALVTLTGAGGAGKSRLAIQIAFELLDHFQDGVFLVRLEPIRDPELVISTIADTLGVRETTGSRPVGEMLKESLRDRQMLLVLDNFEQVVPAAPSVAELLEACPRLKIIVTSRTPLRLRSEKELLVPPLAIPSAEKFQDFERLSQYAAVELFIQRAQAVKPDFSVTDANAPAVAEICFRLDGLPLAIELAAARIRMLTPAELLSRLGHGFDLLRGGMRDLPERQRTLRSAIDWSYNLLNETEQKLFRRLSIFVDGWTWEAAEAVCNLDGDLSPDLEDDLVSLIDNSLVFQFQEAEDQSRFSMLGTIHQYAAERLAESGELERIQPRHASYFLDFVQTVERRIRSAERARWQPVMMREFGNIRAVMEWISTTGNCVEIGQRMAALLGTFWVISGYAREGQQWCDRLLSFCSEATPIAIRAGLLGASGWLAWAQGDQTSVGAIADQSLELFRSLSQLTLDEKHAFAEAMTMRGMLASAERDLATATEMYQKSIEIFQETHDQWNEALALSWLGDIALYANDEERSEKLHQQSIQVARQQGDPWCLMPSLMSSAQVANVKGDRPRAMSYLTEATEILHQSDDQWSLSWALIDMGHILLMEGEPDLAGAFLLEGLSLARTLGNQRVLLIAVTGTAALIARNSTAAGAPQPDIARLSRAANLCGATASYVDQPGVFVWFDSKMLYDSDISQVKSSLGEDLWQQAYAEGKNLPFDQAIALAEQSLKES